MKLVADNILRCMSPEDRKAVGQQTSVEALESYVAKGERSECKIFESWLNLNNLYFIRPNPSVKSTIQIGHPDYTIFWNGTCLFIEMKGPKGKVSDEQFHSMELLRHLGFTAVVCYSADHAIATVKSWKGYH